MDPGALESEIAGCHVVVLIHPNNPTGTRYSRERLLAWHSLLRERGGWLIVDEAFMDVTPECSLAPLLPLPGLIVLRSLGKFFGLAGARVGFVMGDGAVLRDLRESLGPWTVSGPARWVATRALLDRAWQERTRVLIHRQGAKLAALLSRCQLPPDGGCGLFQWVVHPRAREMRDLLARQGILVRCFDEPSSLRFGLPGGEEEWRRVEGALSRLAHAGIPSSGRGALPVL